MSFYKEFESQVQANDYEAIKKLPDKYSLNSVNLDMDKAEELVQKNQEVISDLTDSLYRIKNLNKSEYSSVLKSENESTDTLFKTSTNIDWSLVSNISDHSHKSKYASVFNPKTRYASINSGKSGDNPPEIARLAKEIKKYKEENKQLKRKVQYANYRHKQFSKTEKEILDHPEVKFLKQDYENQITKLQEAKNELDKKLSQTLNEINEKT